MILCGLPIHVPHIAREQRIAAAEDRAEQAAFDAGREQAHVIWDDDDGDWCDHPIAAVISDVNGDHFCAVCNTEWWEDPL